MIAGQAELVQEHMLYLRYLGIIPFRVPLSYRGQSEVWLRKALKDRGQLESKYLTINETY